jgi:hypothetical protein
MDSPILISSLKFMKVLEAKQSEFYSVAEKLYKRAELQLNSRIPSLFPEYTQHDIHHSIRLIETIEELVSDIDALNEFEIFLIIACCLLHDTGMGTDSETIDKIKSNTSGLTDIKFEAMVEKFSGDEQLALQELIRTIHGDLSAAGISNRYSDLFTFKDLRNVSYCEDVMQICRSHTKDHIWLNANLKSSMIKSRFEYNPHYLAILLRLADILDFDGRRTPLFLYNIIRPRGISDKEWTQHFIVSNINKVKLDRESNLNKVSIYGNCSDVNLHRKFLTYVDWINNELEYAVETTSKMRSAYRLFLKTRLELNVDSVGYTVSNYRLNIDFLSITNLLMGEKIYGERSLGIRELIQNSIDACKVRIEKEELNQRFGDDPYCPVIKILLNEEDSLVTIRDNGCGMDEEIIKKYFLNIGKSYYTSDDYLLRRHKYKPIGNYGIGFLSCFMLSEKVIVKTSKPNDKYRYDISLEKNSEYISFTQVEDSAFSGTEVELDYSSFNKVLKEDNITLEPFLRRYFINENIKIIVVNVKDKIETTISNKLNSLSVSGSNEHSIDFTGYLKDCNAFAIVKQKNVFISDLTEVPGVKELVYFSFDPFEFKFSTDDPLSTFLDGESFNFLNIPVYENCRKHDFDTAFRLLDDIDDVIERVEPDFWYSLILKTEDQQHMHEWSLDYDEAIYTYTTNDMDFYEELKKVDFLDFIEKSDCFIPKVFEKREKIFGNSSKTLFMPFVEKEIIGNSFFATQSGSIRIFLRDILVRNHQFKAQFFPNCFELSKLNLNILSQALIPEVSRNKFDNKTTNLINYSITKALLRSSTKNCNFKEAEKNILEEFIAMKYSEPTILVE